MPLDDSVKVFLQQLEHLSSAAVVLGQCVEHLDKGHREPSLCPSPAVLGESCLVVTPEGVARLVVGMTVQAGLGIKGTFIGDLQLIHGIVVYLVGLFWLQLCGSSQTTEG